MYDFFNSKTAIVMSNTERHDMNSWIHMMLDKLEPNIDTFNRVEQDKILAIIADEYANREKTPVSIEIKDNYLKYISDTNRERW